VRSTWLESSSFCVTVGLRRSFCRFFNWH
jgi:hypothetical protein